MISVLLWRKSLRTRKLMETWKRFRRSLKKRIKEAEKEVSRGFKS